MLLNKKATKEFILMIAQEKDPRASKWSRVSTESVEAAEAALKRWIVGQDRSPESSESGKDGEAVTRYLDTKSVPLH